MDLAELQEESHGIAERLGWWDEQSTFGDCLALVHSALGHVLEASRAPGWRDDYGLHWVPVLDTETSELVGNRPVGVASALAVVVVRAAALAERFGGKLGLMDFSKFEPPRWVKSFGDWTVYLHWALDHVVIQATWRFVTAPDQTLPLEDDWSGELSRFVGLTYTLDAHFDIELDAAIDAQLAYLATD